MSGSETTVVIIVVGAVLVFCVAVIWWAVAVRRSRTRKHLAGPGSPDAPPQTDPWRRFAAALAAPYARYEWQITKGRQSKHSEDQTYFGYGVCQPWGTVGQALARDWGVRNEAQAGARIAEGANLVMRTTQALIVADPASDADAIRTRLEAAGTPRRVIDEFQLDEVVKAPIADADLDVSAAELEEAKNTLAFDIGRSANLARWIGHVGLAPQESIELLQDVCGASAAALFDGWGEYADRYVAGLRSSKFTAHKQRVSAVEWLRDDAESPWRRQAWPAGASS
ncbi:DUF1266 domain-containing protein [Microbacterium halophytorum]|uniref:DUF1266 domain-containing protein n=1 Tax=Microbacterium halophytorum TaxID=2067568 RepID=UPI00131A1C52|nr:DUF1266 domain-containing protein [Microbacterium halophytorum]